MKLTVLLFGPYAEAVKESSVTVDIASSTCTAGEVKASLAQQYPKLRGLLSAAILSVNHQAVRPDHLVQESDELAVIGMVSGG